MSQDPAPLTRDTAGSDPMSLLQAWRVDAGAHGDEACLATATTSGAPSARMVLLRRFAPAVPSVGWYTNLDSRKSLELRSNPRAALCCHWHGGAQWRQVRMTGVVQPVPDSDADAYFAQRDEASRMSAHASRQSRVSTTRIAFDERRAHVPADVAAVRPPGWGGWDLRIDDVEFWAGRADRAHDRLLFVRCVDGELIDTGAVRAAGGVNIVRHAGDVVSDPRGMQWLRVRLDP